MLIIRYIVGITGLLIVWFVVAVVVGFIIEMIFQPPSGGFIFAGIGLNWQSVPGTILGLLAGIQSFRASVRRK